MVLGVIAEHSMPMTMAPVVIALAKELAKDSKMLSRIQDVRSRENISRQDTCPYQA